ncbi:hypothetical protein HDV05_002952 [Chytridiales sp. JEL 0842]|nr:hypothetical protein HDV05_002952 [Chytridiales sp. JEL 0842]
MAPIPSFDINISAPSGFQAVTGPHITSFNPTRMLALSALFSVLAFAAYASFNIFRNLKKTVSVKEFKFNPVVLPFQQKVAKLDPKKKDDDHVPGAKPVKTFSFKNIPVPTTALQFGTARSPETSLVPPPPPTAASVPSSAGAAMNKVHPSLRKLKRFHSYPVEEESLINCTNYTTRSHMSSHRVSMSTSTGREFAFTKQPSLPMFIEDSTIVLEQEDSADTNTELPAKQEEIETEAEQIEETKGYVHISRPNDTIVYEGPEDDFDLYDEMFAEYRRQKVTLPFAAENYQQV